MIDDVNKSSERYIVPAVEQASRVLYCLANNRSSYMSITEICAQAGINRSKAFSILKTLQKHELVQRNIGNKGYSLGLGLIQLSQKVLDNFNVPRLAEPILEELAIKLECTAMLGLVSGNKVIYAAKHDAGHDVRVTIRPGRRFPLSYGSSGKAIAAFLAKDDLDRLLQDNNLYFHGTPAKLDRVKLQEELALCRRDGFAIDLGEMIPGLDAVAAPVLGVGETPIGCISVFWPFSGGTAQQSGPFVAEAGKKLSRQLGAFPHGSSETSNKVTEV